MEALTEITEDRTLSDETKKIADKLFTVSENFLSITER